GGCAWKLGKRDDAEKLLRLARASFKGQHPLDAAAAYALGKIAAEKNNPAKAVEFFDAAIAQKAEPLWYLARAESRIAKGDDAGALGDLRVAVELAKSSSQAMKDQTIASLRKSSAALTAKG